MENPTYPELSLNEVSRLLFSKIKSLTFSKETTPNVTQKEPNLINASLKSSDPSGFSSILQECGVDKAE